MIVLISKKYKSTTFKYKRMQL